MNRDKTADFVIIGGGIIGNAIACYLSNKIRNSTTVIDQNHLCTGSTSFSASLVTKLRSQVNLIPLIEETHKSIERFKEKLPDPVGEKRIGCIHVSVSDSTDIQLSNLYRIADLFKINAEFLQPNQVKKIVPWINEKPLRKALFAPDEFYIDGYLLGMAYAREAKLNGTRYLLNSEVDEIVTESGRITGVKIRGNTIFSPVVIVAAGIWSNMLLEKLNISLPVAPVRSLYFMSGINIEKFPANHPICIMPDANAYTRPDNGSLLFGIRDNHSPFYNPHDISKQLHLQNFITPEEKWDILINETIVLQKLIENSGELEIAHTVAAPCAYTHDSNPVIGGIESIKGLYVATGCNGGGIAASGGFGRALAELVLDESPFTDIGPFYPHRLALESPLSEKFMNSCSLARSNKKSG